MRGCPSRIRPSTGTHPESTVASTVTSLRLAPPLAIAVAAAAVAMTPGVAMAQPNPAAPFPEDSTVTELTSFTSPSGNIGCYLDTDTVRCDIAERDWTPPPRPASCPDAVDFGQGVTLSVGRSATFVCAAPETRPWVPVIRWPTATRPPRPRSGAPVCRRASGAGTSWTAGSSPSLVRPTRSTERLGPIGEGFVCPRSNELLFCFATDDDLGRSTRM